MKAKPLPSIDELKERFDFNPDTGEIRYRYTVKRNTAGFLAGTSREDKYVRVRFKGRYYFGHRLMYYVITGDQPQIIDHIDGNVSNNRMSNLRAATNSENMCNHQSRKLAGPYFKGRKWCGRIMKNYKTYRIKPCNTKEEAVESLAKLRKEMHGEFAYQEC